MLCIASHCYVAVARVLSVDFAKSVVILSHCLSDGSTVIKFKSINFPVIWFPAMKMIHTSGNMTHFQISSPS